MAYKPTNKETLEYRVNDELIKNFSKNIKKMQKDWDKLEVLLKETFPNEFFYYFKNDPEKILEKLKELIGTKRYHGKDIKLSIQYEIYKTSQNLLRNFKYEEK